MTLGEFFKGLAENRPLVSAVTAWAVAQVLKTIINYLINKEYDMISANSSKIVR